MVAAGCAASYGSEDVSDGRLGVTTNGTMPLPAEDQEVTTIQKNDVRACVHHRRKRPDKGLESRVREWIAVPMFICS